jgi:hypothetical protein
MVASGLLEVALAKLRTMQMRDTATLYYSIRSYFIHHHNMFHTGTEWYRMVQNGTEYCILVLVQHTGTGTAFVHSRLTSIAVYR